MLHQSIAGGQVYFHNLRMFLQNTSRALKISAVITILVLTGIYFKQSPNINIGRCVTFYHAVFQRELNQLLDFTAPYQNRGKCYILLKNFGTEKVSCRVIIDSSYYSYEVAKLWRYLEQMFFYAIAILFSAFVILNSWWVYLGQRLQEKKLLSGHTIKTPVEVCKYLKRKKLASNFYLGDMPLIKDSETRHILITGSTGSGKTNCLHSLLPQIRAKKQPAIIVDTEGDMVKRYYREGKDIIINPFDEKGVNWDMLAEIIGDKKYAKQLANAIFTGDSADSFSYDEKWNSWAKLTFLGCIEYLLKNKNFTIKELHQMLHLISIEELAKKLQGTSAGNLMKTTSTQNSAPHNIRINVIEATEWLEYLKDIDKTSKDSKSFSFRKWFKELGAKQDKDQWIFISCSGGDTKILLPFFKVLVDVAMTNLIEIGINHDRRVWFVFDELSQLKYIPSLQDNITLLRKYGGCVLVATQSLNQILNYYGREMGAVMLGQFNTSVVFRIIEVNEAKIVARRVGEIEFLMHQKNTSYGASEYRDGVSYSEVERKKELVSVNDFANLNPLEAFVFLPDPNVAISKMQFKLVKQLEK